MTKHTFIWDDKERMFEGDPNALQGLWEDMDHQRLRHDRWWATYNAALTGLVGLRETDTADYMLARGDARAIANAEHGPLTKKET